VPSALRPSALRERNPLPEGTLAVGAGLLVSGVSSYVFLKLVRAGLGSAEATEPVNQLWFLTFLLAPGFFLPVEQEVGRALAHRRAILAVGLAAITTIALVAAGPTLVSQLFHDSWGLLVCLVIAFLAWASGHLTRGVLSGSGRFAPYGLLLGVDGVLRVAAGVALTVGGVKSVAAWGLAVALPQPFSCRCAARRACSRRAPRPSGPRSRRTSAGSSQARCWLPCS
jgi:hypothetical protein